MPDFGLTEALAKAIEAAKGVKVMRPAEAELAARAAKAAPTAAAPVVPGAAPPIDRAPATPPPESVQAPPVNPSQPPADIPAPAADAAATSPAAEPAPPAIAASGADAVAPPDATAASQEPPIAPAPAAQPAVSPANVLPPQGPAPELGAPTPIQEAARRFVTANMGDFPAEKLNMTHMPNVDTMSSPDGLKAAILQIADDNREAITEARRGTISDEQLIGMAQDLAVNGDVLKQFLSL